MLLEEKSKDPLKLYLSPEITLKPFFSLIKKKFLFMKVPSTCLSIVFPELNVGRKLAVRILLFVSIQKKSPMCCVKNAISIGEQTYLRLSNNFFTTFVA